LMEYRKLGNSDLEVSVIGFGCWAMGKRYWGDDVDDELSIRAVHRALDLGVNLFDTADCYGSGHAETVLGQAIKGHRDEMIIATKGARVWDPETLEITGSDISAKHMIEACNASLKRLGIDYIDLYQVHTSYEGAPIEECAEALVKLQEEGKIRYIGVSNYPVEDIRRHMAKAPLASVQPTSAGTWPRPRLPRFSHRTTCSAAESKKSCCHFALSIISVCWCTGRWPRAC